MILKVRTHNAGKEHNAKQLARICMEAPEEADQEGDSCPSSPGLGSLAAQALPAKPIPAETLADKSDMAQRQVAQRARLTSRVSMAAQLTGTSKRASEEAGSMMPQAQQPAGKARRRGASRAMVPDQATASILQAADAQLQPPAKRACRKTGALPMSGAPDQDAAQVPDEIMIAAAELQPPAKRACLRTGALSMSSLPHQEVCRASCAGSLPASHSLATINEGEGEEEKSGPSCAAPTQGDVQAQSAEAVEAMAQQLRKHAVSDAPMQCAQKAAQQGNEGNRNGGAAEQTGDAVPLARISDKQGSEHDSQQMLASKGQHCDLKDARASKQTESQQLEALRLEQSSREDAAASQQNREPVRRSTRRATMAARPGSTRSQPARPCSALSPVMEHPAAADGMLQLATSESVPFTVTLGEFNTSCVWSSYLMEDWRIRGYRLVCMYAPRHNR